MERKRKESINKLSVMYALWHDKWTNISYQNLEITLDWYGNIANMLWYNKSSKFSASTMDFRALPPIETQYYATLHYFVLSMLHYICASMLKNIILHTIRRNEAERNYEKVMYTK